MEWASRRVAQPPPSGLCGTVHTTWFPSPCTHLAMLVVPDQLLAERAAGVGA